MILFNAKQKEKPFCKDKNLHIIKFKSLQEELQLNAKTTERLEDNISVAKLYSSLNQLLGFSKFSASVYLQKMLLV